MNRSPALRISLVAILIVGELYARSRQMERLNRGVVAIKRKNGSTFVSWRLLATDPDDIAFNVYRMTATNAPRRLNVMPLTGATNFEDNSADGAQSNAYFVRSVLTGRKGGESMRFTFPANAPARPYLSIPLQPPPAAKESSGKEHPYLANDASVGDLDGDGEYELIVHMAGRTHDNAHNGVTDPPILQAYKLDGTLLWTINLGRNIRDGAHYTQFMVYDLDGDGKAEVVCKTADGTTDSQGKTIGDPKANHLDGGGRILRGPEFLTVFDHAGRAVATTNYIPSRDPDDPNNLNPTSEQLKAAWGDGYGNRCDRFLACVAYLDGVRPSVVMCRGYYTRTFLVAWDWRDGVLTHRWTFDSKDCPGYSGQGNHNISVADVDNDGKDEIIYGSMAVDDNGKELHTTKLGHCDAIHVSDLDPTHPGLEVFTPHEVAKWNGNVGTSFRDARTGKLLWTTPGSRDIGRAMAADIDPRHLGCELWASNNANLYSAQGDIIGQRPGSMDFAIWWDGDLLRELLDHRGPKGSWHGAVFKWDWLKNEQKVIWEDVGTRSNNWTKGNPCLSADILGDWREEMLWRAADGKELRLYTTTIPTEYRLHTLMHDPVYRLGVAWQNVGYNQPPHPGFFLGHGMKKPPRPSIYTNAK